MSQFSKLIVFGDGLSDQGRFGKLTQNRYPPSPPFLEGRWTNGLTWVEVMAQQLNLPLSAEDNLAQGGATTGYYNINEPLRKALELDDTAPIRGVLAQVDARLAVEPQLDARALYVVWAGGHDFGNYLEYGMPDVVANPPAKNILQALQKLIQAGARNFILGNMPDLGNTPAYYGTEKGKLATSLIDEYNKGLSAAAAALRQMDGVKIFEFNAVQIFTEIAVSPEKFGIKFVAEAYLPTNYINFMAPLAPAQSLPENRKGENPDAYMTFWAVAAGNTVHRVLGERAATAIKNGAFN